LLAAGKTASKKKEYPGQPAAQMNEQREAPPVPAKTVPPSSEKVSAEAQINPRRGPKAPRIPIILAGIESPVQHDNLKGADAFCERVGGERVPATRR
jgi:hypothetical protein